MYAVTVLHENVQPAFQHNTPLQIATQLELLPLLYKMQCCLLCIVHI